MQALHTPNNKQCCNNNTGSVITHTYKEASYPTYTTRSSNMPLNKKVRYETHKNVIESAFENMSAMETAADEEEKGNANKVKDLWDAVLKNEGHTLNDLKGEMNQLSTMQIPHIFEDGMV